MNKKEIISDKQAISMVFLSTLGTTILLGAAKPASENAWISVIIAELISVLIGICYAKLFNDFKGKNLFQICEIVFGKIFGKLFVILYIWYSLYTASLIIRDVGEFISITGLPEAPEVLIMLIFMILCILMANQSMSNFGRWCEFIAPVLIFVILLGYIFSIQNMRPMELLPIMYDGISPVIWGAVVAVSFPFAETIVFIMTFDKLQNKRSAYKAIIIGSVIATITLLVMILGDVMILGKIREATYFPVYSAFRRIKIGDFFERLELILVLSFAFGVLVKVTSFLMAAAKGVACLFSLNDYTVVTAPLGFLVVNIAYLLYGNAMETTENIEINVILCLFFQVVLFFIIFIIAEIKLKKTKKKGTV